MKLLVYVILMTWVFAQMDWQPIHWQWWHNGEWPRWAGGSWAAWMKIRMVASFVLCPPCAALAENYYYVLMEKDAGAEEREAILPVRYTHNPINPHGDWSFYWGQGEGQPWRRVSMLSWYLWWLPPSVVWWLIVRRLFRARRSAGPSHAEVFEGDSHG